MDASLVSQQDKENLPSISIHNTYRYNILYLAVVLTPSSMREVSVNCQEVVQSSAFCHFGEIHIVYVQHVTV
jgi:hypothetical protein